MYSWGSFVFNNNFFTLYRYNTYCTLGVIKEYRTDFVFCFPFNSSLIMLVNGKAFDY